jgi:hypothetical protein
MDKVYLLFDVLGDGDSNGTFYLLSVHKTKSGAFNEAEKHFPDYDAVDEGVKELTSDSFVRFDMTRTQYVLQILGRAGGYLYYGNFGGFVIEESEIQK